MMKKLIFLFLIFPFIGLSQTFYKGSENTNLYKNGSDNITYKGNASPSQPPPTPTCSDGIQNGDETGIDCGGSCPNSCGGDPAPEANFFASSTSITEGQTVSFTNTSINADTYTWTFAGSATSSSNLENPVIQYNTAGNYTVTLQATGPGGSNTETKINYITVNSSGGSGDWTDRNIATPSYAYTNPSFTPPSITTTYTPTSAADLSNPANANKIAIISNSFSASNVTFASGQIIRPAGGSISGTNINLSNAYIEPNTSRAFASSARFSSVYDRSRVYPELFGAVANDSGDDIDAIEAAILNVEFLTAVANGEYITNRDRHAGFFSPLSRSGDFDWDMNNAKMKTTNNSTFRNTPTELTHQGYYVIALADFDRVSIHNGEFDGQNLANRFLDLYNVDVFNINDLHVHNLLSEPNSIPRATAMNFSLFPNNYTQSFITNCLIEDVRNPGDGISNNTNGIAKGLNFSIRENASSDVFINNNTIRNITGDDAEGFYSRNDGNYNNATAELYFHIKNNDLINCQRRGIKYDCSNAFIENNLVESSATIQGNQAAMIQVFSIQAGTPAKNVLIKNNNVRILGVSENSFFGTNDSRDIRVENNTFFSDVLTVRRSLSFSNLTGQQDNLYDGDLSNCTFINNNITNGFIVVNDKYYVLPGLAEIVFENNTQTFQGSISLGAYRGAININASSLGGEMRGDDEFRIRNHTITYDLSTMSSGIWNGVISSNGTEPKNLVLDNVDITYTGSGSVGAVFGGVRNGSVVDYDSTNTIINCNIIGASGTGAIEFNGSDKSVVITNSTGDGNSPITFQ